MLDTRPLRAATFRHLALAYSVNEVGNLVGVIALAILVFDRTHSPLAIATLFLALQFLPALVAQLLTARLEALAARVVLPAIYALEAVIFVALAGVSYHFSLAAVLALAAVDGALAITARALTRSAAANHLLERELLREGNAILNLGAMAANAIGPALGGVIVAWRSVGTALSIDAVSFVVTALIVLWTPGLQIISDTGASAAGRLRAGLREIRAHPLLARLFVVFGLGLMLASVAVPVDVVFAKRALHAGDTGYGLLQATWGAGMVIGGAAFAVSPRIRVMIVLGTSGGLIAVGYGGMAISPDLAVACVFSALGGIGNGAAVVAIVTAIQQAISRTALSSAMAVFEGIAQVMPAAGFLVGGAVAGLYSARTAYAVAAIGVAVVMGVSAARSMRPFETQKLAVGE